LPAFILKNKGMELNGALSNPRLAVELGCLGALHEDLLLRAEADPRQPRPPPPKTSRVLETVTLVLELAERSMRTREIHAAAEQLFGQPLRWTSVKGAIAGHVSGPERRFRRVRRGVYKITGASKQVARPP
jgi:hypothetical protein